MFPRKSGGVATIKLHWQSIFFYPQKHFYLDYKNTDIYINTKHVEIVFLSGILFVCGKSKVY